MYFAEHDHRLKIENIVVADQVRYNCRMPGRRPGVIRQRHPFFVFDKLEHFVMYTNSRPRIYIKWGLINKDIRFY